jgi:hypothetical protein
MRTALVAALLAAGLVTALAELRSGPTTLQAQALPGGSAELITHVLPGGDKYQQVLVVDPRLRVASVYHIETATGVISLRSVRQIHWDLQLAEYNGVNPLPREIRLMLDHP